jgi:hypothetical protein
LLPNFSAENVEISDINSVNSLIILASSGGTLQSINFRNITDLYDSNSIINALESDIVISSNSIIDSNIQFIKTRSSSLFMYDIVIQNALLSNMMISITD